ncbi:N-acetylmannosamine-6-phosphate 2-epimerase [Labrys okinawensis]|uniref:N-acylglucosamine-6-phosphate 2-epimerase n=1 Tax=Labrys okinawensis TaxID=346911 RepID=A0A2S9Q4V5_9HYPH|nr:N-acetylmannosamine-6-phosphate 2-epimerase [Labrys okinawensis]
MDRTEIVVGFALAAAAGGAAALRIEGLANVRAVRAATSLPVIGLVKRAEANTPVFITPLLQDVADLADAGADIIAFDATQRVRPVSVPALIAAIHAAGRQSMADCADLADAVAAAEAGASVIGTTLSGYVGGPVPEEPDIGLVRRVVALGRPVFAEGRYRTLAQVQAARQAGADAVVVGSAITRPEHITSWFVEAVKSPSAPSS